MESLNPYELHYKQAFDLFIQTGSLERVQQYADSLDDEDYRDSTLAKMARFLASAACVEGSVSGERLNQVIQMCTVIRDPIDRADTLFDIGRELAARGYTDPPKETLAKEVFRLAVDAAELAPESSSEKPAIFLQIAVALSQLGQQGEAESLLRRAIHLALGSIDFDCAKTLKGCALVLARWNRMQEAQEIAQSIQVPELRTLTLQRLDTWPK